MATGITVVTFVVWSAGLMALPNNVWAHLAVICLPFGLIGYLATEPRS
jgi:hypothetical protein